MINAHEARLLTDANTLIEPEATLDEVENKIESCINNGCHSATFYKRISKEAYDYLTALEYRITEYDKPVATVIHW